MMLVTTEETMRRLRLDDDALDMDLQGMIESASDAVVRYLKSGASAFIDSNGELIPDAVVPASIKAAVILLVGVWVRDPDGSESSEWEHGYLPRPVTSLLYPFRDPAFS